MNQILIIDNDSELCHILSKYLDSEGFSTQACLDAKTGLKTALTQTFDAIILDLMLSTISGFDVLRKIRAHSQVPVMMLTAKTNEVDKIIGLEIGADDFLTKPCNPRELLARLKAIIRRADTTLKASNTISIDGLTIDPAKHTATLNNVELELTNAEFNILQLFMRSPEQAFSKEDLTKYALGRKFTAFDRSIDVHISNLRNKLSASDQDNLPSIKTVRGFGYMLSSSKHL